MIDFIKKLIQRDSIFFHWAFGGKKSQDQLSQHQQTNWQKPLVHQQKEKPLVHQQKN